LPFKLKSGRAAAGSSGRLLFAAAALLFAFTFTAQARQAAGAKQRITTASNVRVRNSPDTASEEVARLQLGTVVEELERSQEKAKVGASEDFWHLVSAPGGARGWVFGGLVAPFDPAGRDAVYLGLANERLANPAATFADLSELVRFLDRAAREVKARNTLAELELARLVALARSLAALPFEHMGEQPYKAWTDEREKEVVYSDPAGQWYVRQELFWNLQRKYAGLPVAERAAWEGAQTPMPGECEGYLPCYLYMEIESNGKYLKLYPRGAHADAALDSLSEMLGHIVEGMRGSNSPYEVPRDDRANFLKSLAALRAQLALVPAAKKARVLGQLDAIAKRFP
jgi:hypothetical protein